MFRLHLSWNAETLRFATGSVFCVFVVVAIDNHCGTQGRAETLRFIIFTSFWCFGDSITIIVNLGVQGRAETLRFASGSEAVIRRCSDFNRFPLFYPARALRALGLLLADGTPTGGRGEDFLSRQPDFFTETAVTPERKVEKSFPRWEINRHVEG